MAGNYTSRSRCAPATACRPQQRGRPACSGARDQTPSQVSLLGPLRLGGGVTSAWPGLGLRAGPGSACGTVHPGAGGPGGGLVPGLRPSSCRLVAASLGSGRCATHSHLQSMKATPLCGQRHGPCGRLAPRSRPRRQRSLPRSAGPRGPRQTSCLHDLPLLNAAHKSHRTWLLCQASWAVCDASWAGPYRGPWKACPLAERPGTGWTAVCRPFVSGWALGCSHLPVALLLAAVSREHTWASTARGRTPTVPRDSDGGSRPDSAFHSATTAPCAPGAWACISASRDAHPLNTLQKDGRVHFSPTPREAPEGQWTGLERTTQTRLLRAWVAAARPRLFLLSLVIPIWGFRNTLPVGYTHL